MEPFPLAIRQARNKSHGQQHNYEDVFSLDVSDVDIVRHRFYPRADQVSDLGLLWNSLTGGRRSLDSNNQWDARTGGRLHSIQPIAEYSDPTDNAVRLSDMDDLILTNLPVTQGGLMRILSITFMTVIVAATALAQNDLEPFSIQINTSKQTVKAGSAVSIQILMTNTGSHEVDCTSTPKDDLDRAYQYDVRDSSGQTVAAVERNVPEESNGGWGRPRSIKPGETCEAFGEFISNSYDLSKPGTYSIQVSRRISSDPKDGVVKSNIITITVTP